MHGRAQHDADDDVAALPGQRRHLDEALHGSPLQLPGVQLGATGSRNEQRVGDAGDVAHLPVVAGRDRFGRRRAGVQRQDDLHAASCARVRRAVRRSQPARRPLLRGRGRYR